MKTKTQTKAGGIKPNHNQAKATKKKLVLSRETVKNLKTMNLKSTLKAGAACPSPETDDCV